MVTVQEDRQTSMPTVMYDGSITSIQGPALLQAVHCRNPSLFYFGLSQGSLHTLYAISSMDKVQDCLSYLDVRVHSSCVHQIGISSQLANSRQYKPQGYQ